MKPSTEFRPNTGLSILCIGDPGAGKTRLAMSFPTPGFIDCDGNLNSAARLAGSKKWFYSQPFKDDAGKEVPEVDRWNRAVSEVKLMLTNPEIETVIIDSWGPLCAWALLHAENELRKAGIDVKKEYLAKYNAFIPLMTGFITMLKIPGKYVIVNAHQVMEKGELTGTLSFILDMPGNSAFTLGRLFNDVWVMSATANPMDTKYAAKYELCTKPTGFHVSPKTSLDLPPRLDLTGKTPDQIWAFLSPQLSSTQTQPNKTS